MKTDRGGEMAHQIKALAVKPNNQVLYQTTRDRKGTDDEKLSSGFHMHTMACSNTTQVSKINRKSKQRKKG